MSLGGASARRETEKAAALRKLALEELIGALSISLQKKLKVKKETAALVARDVVKRLGDQRIEEVDVEELAKQEIRNRASQAKFLTKGASADSSDGDARRPSDAAGETFSAAGASSSGPLGFSSSFPAGGAGGTMSGRTTGRTEFTYREGFTLPPKRVLSPPKDQGLWAEVTRMDRDLAEAEAAARAMRNAAKTATYRGALDRQMAERNAEAERQRQEREAQQREAQRIASEYRRAQADAAARRAERQAEMSRDISSFTASMDEQRRRAREMRLAEETAELKRLEDEARAARDAAAARKREKMEELAAYKSETEALIAGKRAAEAEARRADAELLQKQAEALEAREKAREDILRGRLEAIKRKMDLMGDTWRDKEAAERAAKERAEREAAERNAKADAAAAARAAAKAAALNDTIETLRRQTEEKRAAEEARRREAERIQAAARQQDAEDVAAAREAARQRAERARQVQRDLERQMLTQAQVMTSVDETTLERTLNTRLLDANRNKVEETLRAREELLGLSPRSARKTHGRRRLIS